MSNSIQGFCGTVDIGGKIISNGNFTCQYPEINVYNVGYSGNVTNPVPVVTLTGPNSQVSFTLETNSSGFTVTVYDRNGQPIPSAFDFIVGEIV